MYFIVYYYNSATFGLVIFYMYSRKAPWWWSHMGRNIWVNWNIWWSTFYQCAFCWCLPHKFKHVDFVWLLNFVGTCYISSTAEQKCGELFLVPGMCCVTTIVPQDGFYTNVHVSDHLAIQKSLEIIRYSCIILS